MPKLFKRPTSLIDHAATRSSHTMATSSWAVLVAAMGLMATMSFAAPDVPGANLPESSFLLKGMEANTGPALRAIESWELGGSASIECGVSTTAPAINTADKRIGRNIMATVLLHLCFACP